jgi:hypothetical protein
MAENNLKSVMKSRTFAFSLGRWGEGLSELLEGASFVGIDNDL